MTDNWVDAVVESLLPDIIAVFGTTDLAELIHQRDRHQPNDNGDGSIGCDQCGGCGFPCMERVAFDRLIGQAGGERAEPDW